MAVSRVDSYEVIPQGDEKNSENSTLGSGAFRDQPDDEDLKANPKPKLRNDTSATKKKSNGKILKQHEIEEFIKNIAALISNVSLDDFDTCVECLDKLLDLYQFSVESQNQTGDWLNKYGVTEKLMFLLEESQHFPDEDEDGQNIFLSTLTVCRNFTEACPVFSMELASLGIVAFLSTSLKHALISSETTSSEVLKLYICILHNIAIHSGGDIALFMEARTSQALKEFASCEVNDIKLTSVLTMGYMCSFKKIKRLQIQAEDIVTICVEWLKESMENKRTRRKACLQPWAIISGLTKLAVNDQMSQELKRTDLIQCVTEIMNTSLNSTDQTACYEFLTATKSKVSEKKSTETIKKQISEKTPESASTQRNSVQPETRTTNKHTDVKYFHQTREYDLLLIGKTGNGKSAVGNTIIGRNAFKSCASSTSVTRDITFEFVKFKQCFIKVVDGPGVVDTDGIEDITKATQVIASKMQYAVTLNPAGYHAFLLVVKFGNRFTAEENHSIKVLKHIFGEDFVRNYCILLMTYGDNFKEENGNMPFREWCEQQDGFLKVLLTECNGKVVLFDNKSKDERVRHEQIEELLRVIDSMKFAGQRYTDNHFQMAAAGREKLLLESKEPMLSEATVRKVSLITQELDEVHKAKEEDQREKFAELTERAQDLHRKTLELDNGTGVLKKSIETTKTLVKIIADRIHSLDKILAERRRLIQKQEEVKKDYAIRLNFHARELEKLTSDKRMREQNDLERQENMRRKHDSRIKEIADRAKNAVEKFNKKRKKLNETFKSSTDKIHIKLQDPNIYTAARKKLENKNVTLKTDLEEKLSKIESQEHDLIQNIDTERQKAVDEMEEEKKVFENEKQRVNNLINAYIAEMKSREEVLTKQFEAEKKELQDDYLKAFQNICAINDIKQRSEEALMIRLYETMKNAFQDSVNALTKKEQSSCILL